MFVSFVEVVDVELSSSFHIGLITFDLLFVAVFSCRDDEKNEQTVHYSSFIV